MCYLSQTLITLSTKLISAWIYLARIIPNQRPNFKLSIYFKQSWIIQLHLLSRVSTPCAIVVIFIISIVKLVNSTFFLQKWNTTWDSIKYSRTAMKKKSARKIGMYTYEGGSLDVVHDWIWLRVCLFHYYHYFGHVFLVKKKAYDPKFTKSIILLTAHWKQQSKTRDHLCFICKLWSLNIWSWDTSGKICALSSIHQLFNSSKLLICLTTSQKTQWAIKLTINQILQT